MSSMNSENLDQGSTTQTSWWTKNFFLQYSRAKSDIFFWLKVPSKQGKRTQNWSVWAKLKASVGHILYMPDSVHAELTYNSSSCYKKVLITICQKHKSFI